MASSRESSVRRKSSRDHRQLADLRENYPDGFVEDCSIKKRSPPTKYSYNPVSLALSLQNNILLTADGSYNIQFSTGMLEGSGISINESGDSIKFYEDGSYQFTICGDATPFSDVSAKLVYHHPSFNDDIKIFSQTDIPQENGKLQLRGLITTLPLRKNQEIQVKIIPTPNESIIVMAGTRLLVHRIA